MPFIEIFVFFNLYNTIDEYIILYNTKNYKKRLSDLSPLQFRTLAA
ncbi:IS3 family transposase [Clostridium estertheticum]|nr:IS3 family transposase [Clostridium estertheticum]WLC72564.1 IS3 family transposase [Clostridium estertheticum]